MADYTGRQPQDSSNANRVQDVELQRVPRQVDGALHDESGGRRLSLRAVLVHDAHLQMGRYESEGCRICGQGLEGALEKTPQGGPRRGTDEVAESGGADEELAAASSRVDREGRKEDKVLWR